MTEPQTIARGLTKVQREWLIWLGHEGVREGCFVDGQKDAIASLVLLNLVECIRKAGWRSACYRLLPLGAAVRDVLLRESGGRMERETALEQLCFIPCPPGASCSCREAIALEPSATPAASLDPDRARVRAETGVPDRKEMKASLGWKPIDTAPRNGEPFLGAVIDPQFRYGYLLVEITRWIPPKRFGSSASAELPGLFAGEVSHPPFTHWMELPAVPSERAGLVSELAPADPLEVCEALEEAALWHDAQAKALSKQPAGGDRDWRRGEHTNQAEKLRQALEALREARK